MKNMLTKNPDTVIWDDVLMIALALVSAYLLALEYSVPLTPIELLWIGRIDTIIALIFLFEFCIKLLLAESKAVFFKSNWLYLLASIPVTTPATQTLRLLRLLRLARLFRLHTGTQEVVTHSDRLTTQTRLFYVLTIWSIIIFSGTIAFFAFEHRVNEHVQTLFDSFWWAMATVTTIGYGDIVPITTAGRIVGIILMITGLGTTAIITALVASFLIREKTDKTP